MTTPHELKRSPTTLERCNTGKEKERKMKKFGRQLFHTRCKQGTEIAFSFNRSTRYKTRWVRKKKRRYTSSRVSRARFGLDEPEVAPSYELRLYPSPVRVTALAPSCLILFPKSQP